MDLTITFIVKKDEKEKDDTASYEILKNVPDVRVYFVEEKASQSQPIIDDYNDEEELVSGPNNYDYDNEDEYWEQTLKSKWNQW